MRCPACDRDGFYVGFHERDCGNTRCSLYSERHKEDSKPEEKTIEMPDFESCGMATTTTTTSNTTSYTMTCCGCGGGGCSTCNGTGYVTANNSSISGSSTTTSNPNTYNPYTMP